MPSKWSWLRGKFPVLPVDPTYDQVVGVMMDQHRGKGLEQLAARLNELEAIKEIQENFVSKTNAEITAVERLMSSEFLRTNVESIRVGGFSFSPKPSPAPKVVDQSAFHAYVEKHMPDIFTVNYQTMAAIVNGKLEKGDDIPPGIEVNVRDTISRRKG